jgi:hypothetical protein
LPIKPGLLQNSGNNLYEWVADGKALKFVNRLTGVNSNLDKMEEKLLINRRP